MSASALLPQALRLHATLARDLTAVTDGVIGDLTALLIARRADELFDARLRLDATRLDARLRDALRAAGFDIPASASPPTVPA